MKVVSPALREARRLQAWKLHRQGWSQRAIADLLEVNASRVNRWLQRARLAGGAKALRRRKAPGAARRLPRARRPRLRTLLRRGAEAHGFQGALWSRPRVAVLIARAFGVNDSPRHVGRLLAEMSGSLPRPLRRARQRDEAKIARWRARSVGRPFKQSQTPRPEHFLRGRERLLSPACRGAYLRSTRPDANPARVAHARPSLGHRRRHALAHAVARSGVAGFRSISTTFGDDQPTRIKVRTAEG